MSSEAIRAVMKNSKATGTDLNVLWVLAWYIGTNGEPCFPSYRTIADGANISKSGVPKVIKRLIKSGDIEVISVGKNKHYKLPYGVEKTQNKEWTTVHDSRETVDSNVVDKLSTLIDLVSTFDHKLSTFGGQSSTPPERNETEYKNKNNNTILSTFGDEEDQRIDPPQIIPSKEKKPSYKIKKINGRIPADKAFELAWKHVGNRDVNIPDELTLAAVKVFGWPRMAQWDVKFKAVAKKEFMEIYNNVN